MLRDQVRSSTISTEELSLRSVSYFIPFCRFFEVSRCQIWRGLLRNRKSWWMVVSGVILLEEDT